MTSSGWRGFLNLNSWLLVIFTGSYLVGDWATAAGWFDVGVMLSVAAVPVGVVMGFGITYAADAWGRRVARHGLDREAETAALVGTYFFASPCGTRRYPRPLRLAPGPDLVPPVVV